MTAARAITVSILAIAATGLTACGTAKPGGMGGPSMNNKVGTDNDPPPPKLQSNDILAREQLGYIAEVQHVLIGWRDLKDNSDKRAKNRSKVEAEGLARQILQRARAGDKFEDLMREYSEDPGSANGQSYTVEPGGKLVLEFRQLALRLEVDEIGIVLTQFGWHIMKRIE